MPRAGPLLTRRLQGQRAGVDAVALPGRARPVREDVPEVAAAGRAGDLGADHPVAAVDVRVDALERHRLDEARPACARVELRLGAEELRAAARTAVDAGRLGVEILAGERPLGALLAQNVVLRGREPLAPLGLCDVSLLHGHTVRSG